MKTRKDCPAWELGAGHLCWFINGTICQGLPQKSWRKKMDICKRCEVLQSLYASDVKSKFLVPGRCKEAPARNRAAYSRSQSCRKHTIFIQSGARSSAGVPPLWDRAFSIARLWPIR